jgi:hypothetical protein
VRRAVPRWALAAAIALGTPVASAASEGLTLDLRMQSEETYDLITGEPPPITEAGIVHLYTREFFELARSRLRERGFVTYWLPIYQVGEGVARSVVRSFREVFPGAVLLSGHQSELLLVGRKGASLELPRDLQRRIDADPALKRELRWISLDHAADWVALLAGTDATLERATRDAPAVTDDRPLLEYGSPAWRDDRRLPADLFSLADVEVWCPACRAPELAASEREAIEGALEVVGAYYRSRAFLVPTSGQRFAPRLSAAGRDAVQRSRYLREVTGRLPRAQGDAANLRQHGRIGEALARLERLVAVRPDDGLARLDLADLKQELGVDARSDVP